MLRTRQRSRLRGEDGSKNADPGMPRPVPHANSRACCCPLRHNGSGVKECTTIGCRSCGRRLAVRHRTRRAQLAPRGPMSTRHGRDSTSFVPPVSAEVGSCASCRRSPGSRAARSVAFTRWAAPPGARSAPSVRPSPAPWDPRTSPRASASRSATRRPQSQGTVLLAVSALAADRHKANHLGAPVLQFLCRRHNRVPAHLESRSLASSSTCLADPSARRRSGRLASSPMHHPPRPMDHWPAGGRRDFQTPNGAVPRIDTHQVRWTSQTACTAPCYTVAALLLFTTTVRRPNSGMTSE
jgi:hypothetical protein